MRRRHLPQSSQPTQRGSRRLRLRCFFACCGLSDLPSALASPPSLPSALTLRLFSDWLEIFALASIAAARDARGVIEDPAEPGVGSPSGEPMGTGAPLDDGPLAPAAEDGCSPSMEPRSMRRLSEALRLQFLGASSPSEAVAAPLSSGFAAGPSWPAAAPLGDFPSAALGASTLAVVAPSLFSALALAFASSSSFAASLTFCCCCCCRS
mmetsp:Transcript_30725/g.97857  ORF Transcript_30725/g.97857 Transcript_30725/m.97857 type:complete len:209 (+) Transcript_30725:199-825(+)